MTMARRGQLQHVLPGIAPPPKAVRPWTPEEAAIQKDIVKALHRVLPRGAKVHASLNEVRKGKDEEGWRDQSIAKAMGIFVGHSDLTVYGPARPDGTPGVVLFLECKAPGNGLSEKQEAFRDWALAQGHAWALVRSPSDAIRAVEAAGIRTLIVGARP